MPKHRFIIIYLSAYLIAFLNTPIIHALDDNSYANGWYWGKNSKENEEHDLKANPALKRTVKGYNNTMQGSNSASDISDANDTTNTSNYNKPNKSDSQILNDINKEVEELKATAILNPTVNNVSNYIAAQNKVVNMASGFTQSWTQAMLQKPELNYISTHPVNNYAQQILTTEKQQNTQAALNLFAKEYGLIFFFKGTDKLAAFQSKIIKSITTKYNIAIIPVAIDNTPNEYFPNLIKDNGRANTLGIKITPAVIAMHSRAGKTTPLAFGIVSENELEERIADFINKEKSL